MAIRKPSTKNAVSESPAPVTAPAVVNPAPAPVVNAAPAPTVTASAKGKPAIGKDVRTAFYDFITDASTEPRIFPTYDAAKAFKAKAQEFLSGKGTNRKAHPYAVQTAGKDEAGNDIPHTYIVALDANEANRAYLQLNGVTLKRKGSTSGVKGFLPKEDSVRAALQARGLTPAEIDAIFARPVPAVTA